MQSAGSRVDLSTLRKMRGQQNNGLIQSICNNFDLATLKAAVLQEILSILSESKPEHLSDVGILKGDIQELSISEKETVLLFISSTFVDTKFEQDHLLENIFPFLKTNVCGLLNLNFNIVSMRWGVRAKAGDAHATSELCLRELEKCKKNTLSLAYITLQSGRYGYRPFPDAIEAEEFQRIREYLSTTVTSTSNELNTPKLDLSLLMEPYWKLEEAAEPQYYKLQPISSLPGCEFYILSEEDLEKAKNDTLYKLERDQLRKLASDNWWKIFTSTQELLRIGSETLSDEQKLKYFISVTHNEVNHGIFQNDNYLSQAMYIERNIIGIDEALQSENKEERIIASLYKDIETLPTSTSTTNTTNEKKLFDEYQLLRQLQDQCRSLLSSNGLIFCHNVPWVDYRTLDPKNATPPIEWREYLESFGKEVLAAVADSIFARYKRPATDFLTIDLKSQHDSVLSKIQDKGFLREDIMNHITNYVLNQNNNSNNNNDNNNNKPLIVHGNSGCGKSWIMCQAVKRLKSVLPPDTTTIIYRLLGTSLGSADALSLVSSIHHQWHRVLGKKETDLQDWESAATWFQTITWPTQGLLVLVLDSIDQLSAQYGALSQLCSWLPGLQSPLKPNIKVVLSTLPGDRGISLLPQFVAHGCSLVECPAFTFNDATIEEGILRMVEAKPATGIIISSKRKLTSAAKNLMIELIRINSTPLFIKIVLDMILAIPSYQNLNPIGSSLKLAASSNGIPGVINIIFENLESQHGKKLVASFLGLLTLSREGLSETEAEDIISTMDDVLDDIYEWWVPPFRRIPPMLVQRIITDLGQYLVQRRSESGLMVYTWYHRQFREAATNRYLVSDMNRKQNLLLALSNYFGNTIDENMDPAARLISPQPIALTTASMGMTTNNRPSIWNPDTVPNKRRCAEAAEHMIEGNLFRAAIDELCTLEAVCARAKTGSGGTSELFHMIKQLKDILRLSNEENSQKQILTPDQKNLANHYLRWVSKQAYKILEDPSTNLFATASLEPEESYVKRHLIELWNSMPNAGSTGWGQRGSWVRARMLGGSSVFDPLLGILRGHTGGIRSVAFNRDATKIAVASNDGKVRVWDANNFALEQTLVGHTAWVGSVVFSPDGKKIISGSDDSSTRIWGADTGAKEKVLQGAPGWVLSATCSHDGTRIVSGSENATIYIWDMNTGSLVLKIVGHSGHVRSVSFSKDDTKILSSSADGSVRLWNAQSGTEVKRYLEHKGWVWSAAFSHDDSKIVSCGQDGKILIWDTATANLDRSLVGDHKGSLMCGNFNHDSSKLITGDSEGVVCIWDTNNWQTILTLRPHEGRRIRAVSFNRDSSKFLTGAEDGCVCVWEGSAQSGSAVHIGHTDVVASIAFSRDGLKLVSGSEDGKLCIWNASSCDHETSFHVPDKIASVSYNFDGTKVLLGTHSGDVCIVEGSTGMIAGRYKAHPGQVYCISSNADGSKVVSGGKDNDVSVWHSNTNQVQKMAGHTSAVFSISYNSNGTMIASGSDDRTIILWDDSSSQIKSVLRGHRSTIQSVSFNGAGNKLVSGSDDGEVVIWDTSTCQKLLVLNDSRNSGRVKVVQFNYEGTKIVSCANEHDEYLTANGVRIIARPRSKILIWNAITGVVDHAVNAHTSWVQTMCWNPNGSKIVTGSNDMKVCILDSIL